jgi:hypothetical protein
MKTKNINVTYIAVLATVFFAISIALSSAQTLNRPLLGPDPHSSSNQKIDKVDSLKKDRSEFVGKLQDAKQDAKESRVQLREKVKDKLQDAKNKDARKDILKSTNIERKTMLENIKNRRREILSEAKTDAGHRIKAFLKNILNRFDKTLEKFVNILERINDHVLKLKERGADTTAVDSAIEIAEELVRKANVEVDSVHSKFEEALASDNPREFINEIKNASRIAANSIKEAHRAINAAIQELKKASRNLKSAENKNVDSQSDADENDDNITE